MKTTVIQYCWQGINKQGQKIQGEITAQSRNLAKVNLLQQGIHSIKIQKKSSGIFTLINSRITQRDLTILFRQLATMIAAGIPLVQSFSLMAEGQVKSQLKNLLINIKNELQKGNSLTKTLQSHPRYFDELTCSLVNTGEQSGTLETMLQRIALHKEKSALLERKIIKALFYPMSVLSIALIITGIMLICIVPRFEELFQNFGGKLPAFTRSVIYLSQTLREKYWLYLLIIMAAILVWHFSLRRFPRLKYQSNYFILQLPLIGMLLRKAILARFARCLAITHAAGIPLLDALKTVASTAGNLCYTQSITKLQTQIACGQQLHFAMTTQPLFPPMLIQMVKIGEESGSLDTMLEKIAEFYEADIDSVVDNLSSLLEPLIMVVLGVLIGGLVIAMYLPIFKLGTVI